MSCSSSYLDYSDSLAYYSCESLSSIINRFIYSDYSLKTPLSWEFSSLARTHSKANFLLSSSRFTLTAFSMTSFWFLYDDSAIFLAKNSYNLLISAACASTIKFFTLNYLLKSSSSSFINWASIYYLDYFEGTKSYRSSF